MRPTVSVKCDNYQTVEIVPVPHMQRAVRQRFVGNGEASPRR
jgi:hypothetical protein